MKAEVEIREAERSDVAAIAAMFAEDELGGHGDSADPAELPAYMTAFDRISASPNDRLFVAVRNGAVVGTFQTTLITSLTGRGSSNMTIEAVHTRNDMRGHGIGEAMITHAIDEARANGARLVQLMSNANRADAHRFYSRLGFSQSHLGFKMKLRNWARSAGNRHWTMLVERAIRRNMTRLQTGRQVHTREAFMKALLLQMFTWWNGQTWGTRFHTWRHGTRVGEDSAGNIYYEGGSDSEGRTRRWVIYNGYSEASAISPAGMAGCITAPMSRLQPRLTWQSPGKKTTWPT